MAAILCAFLLFQPVRAQDDTRVTPSGSQAPDPQADENAGEEPKEEPREEPGEDEIASEPARINLSVTVPSGEVNEAQVQECVDEADAGQISGEIIVCRRIGRDGDNALSSSRAEAQRRYAEETAFKDAPRTPNVSGLPDNGRGISVGKTPPPALIIDVEALPDAPAGSDADRIARGLPPLGQDENLTEEEIRERREKLGLPPPAFEKKPN
ncbi:MAG: hypothetical protein AAF650_04435 [Pseudomonadota bacterium]